MSKTENALKTYARTKSAIEDHIKANKPLFDAHEKLVMENIDARASVEEAAAEELENVTAEGFKVTVVPQTQTWADIEEIDSYVANGNITQAMRARIVKTQDRPPRISITELK